MNNWYLIEVESQRRQAEAETKARRHWEEALPVAKPVHHTLSQRLLRRLGDQLVLWGCRMQARASTLGLAADHLVVEPQPSPCSS
jgi:hypothetical protein